MRTFLRRIHPLLAAVLLSQTIGCAKAPQSTLPYNSPIEVTDEVRSLLEPPVVALTTAYPDFRGEVNMLNQDGMHVFQVHAFTDDATLLEDPEALPPHLDEVMLTAIDALTEPERFDVGEMIFTVDGLNIDKGDFMIHDITLTLARPMSDWQELAHSSLPVADGGR